MRWVMLVMCLWAGTGRAETWSIKIVKTAPPKHLSATIRKTLDTKAIQLLRDDALVAEVWLRRGVEVKATKEQIDNGLTYEEVPGGTLLGAIRLSKDYRDYRKQAIPAGVYTLRLATQPTSDDHFGTAPHKEFCLLSKASDDTKSEVMTFKALVGQSKKINTEHPLALLVFPGKGATATTKLVDKGKGHRVLLVKLDVRAGERKATLEFGLCVVGATAAEK